MFKSKARRAVKPVEEQNPSELLREHVMKKVDVGNVLVSEYNVLDRVKPLHFCMRDLTIPLWLVLLLISIGIILYTAFGIFASIVTLKKETNGGPCKSNSDCRQDLGLLCNNYRCGCAYSHFWSDSYQICERRRMINRTCDNDSMCDILANLECQNGTVAGSSQCQCKSSMSWNGYTCVYQTLYNTTCLQNANCDWTRFLYCNLTVNLCLCNTSMFWNGNTISGTCEYKRTIGQYCYPYDDTWCDYSAPVGQGLVCTDYSNPYGSEYGICQCGTYAYYNGTAAAANGVCVPLHLYNQTCTSTSQCDYRINLSCLNNLCLCPSADNYDSTIYSSGVMGRCVAAAGYLDNCSTTILCSSSQNLYCNFNYSGVASTIGQCQCNGSWSYWDGITCASKLSIGGQCSNDINCIAANGLFCSTYTQSNGTCDCNQYYYWNSTCVLKLWYNDSCSSSYVCDDNRGLQCQGLGGSMFQKCDCYNTSFMWDSLYVARSHTCILKLGFTVSTCYGDLECQDYNYLICTNGTCLCAYTDYWDGNRCQPKRNYTDPCSMTSQCRDYSPVNLICRNGSTVPPVPQCLCSITSFWSQCLQACIVSKQRQQPCTLVANCTSNECDVTKNLQCINDSVSNVTTGGWCNCTTLQWWNGTYCRDKGIPSWGSNSSAICNATYQCADYNLVSCPLGGLGISTCECATTKYWNGVTCLDRGVAGASCTSWPTSPVNTTTCLSAAGAGLTCSGANCLGNGTCINGICTCTTGSWNSVFLLCMTGTG